MWISLSLCVCVCLFAIDCIINFGTGRSQRRIAEAFAHPRTQVLKTHEAAVKFVQAHEAALDAFLACHGTAKVL